jgi:DNA-binding PadR family transcriptional regulator
VALSGLGKSEPALTVLVSLLEGPKHGYAISKDIERLTGRRPGPGTLYGAISRLESDGLIAAEPETERRRPYSLTAAGRREVERELDAMAALASEGRRRIQAVPA